jgi:hypothetical protein
MAKVVLGVMTARSTPKNFPAPIDTDDSKEKARKFPAQVSD